MIYHVKVAPANGRTFFFCAELGHEPPHTGIEVPPSPREELQFHNDLGHALFMLREQLRSNEFEVDLLHEYDGKPVPGLVSPAQLSLVVDGYDGFYRARRITHSPTQKDSWFAAFPWMAAGALLRDEMIRRATNHLFLDVRFEIGAFEADYAAQAEAIAREEGEQVASARRYREAVRQFERTA